MTRTSLAGIGALVVAAAGAIVGLSAAVREDADAARFSPPSAAHRKRALGSTRELSPTERRAYDPTHDFEPMGKPRGGEWLDVHPEPGQTFDAFRRAKRNVPDAKRRTIYLLPVGAFDARRSPDLEKIRKCAAAYFALPVKILPAHSLEGLTLTTRRNAGTGRRQYLTRDLLSLLGRKLPKDGYCLLGVTMEDLYPHPDWNFVFGQATLSRRVGVYSFARYDPAFYGEKRSPADRERDRQLVLYRSAKVLVHETAHMFGIRHCIYYRCIVNGSNSLTESDSRGLPLCPVCLRKLASSAGFDVVKRYRRLRDVYRELGFRDEVAWIDRRLGRITTGE